MTYGHAERMVSDADHVSLSRLVVEFAWRVDHGQADRVWELFVPDGVLDTGGAPLAGHDAIRDWGRARAASTSGTAAGPTTPASPPRPPASAHGCFSRPSRHSRHCDHAPGRPGSATAQSPDDIQLTGDRPVQGRHPARRPARLPADSGTLMAVS